MTNTQWFILIGFLLLARGLTSTMLQRSPLTSPIVYLVVGVIVGPVLLNVFTFDPLHQSGMLEVLTEVAVLISLFSAGVKMPVPFRLRRWRAPLMLAWGSMTITVLLVAGFSVLALGLPIGAGVLLGAVLAPTDPVLATDVQSRHPGDNDELRFTLTSEAGMNDGTAFPFVMLGLGLLGLHEIGDAGARWLLLDLLWATLAAIMIGVLGGALMAQTGWRLRVSEPRYEALDDLVSLGLIALVYGISLALHAWGFLAVFAAGVALRQTELMLARAAGVKPKALAEDEDLARVTTGHERGHPPIVSVEALMFNEHLERLSELVLVLLLGGMLMVEFWNWRAVGLALFVFFIARPVSVFIGLAGTATNWRIRSMVSWFGVRGIGSIYYLMYAIQHGTPHALARDLIQLTLTTVALSIVVHGISVRPLMHRFGRAPDK